MKMKDKVLVLAAGLCAAFCSCAETNVEARFVALSSTAARNLGLKWNMLQKGIGIERANVAGAMTYQHIPDGVSSYKENYTKGRNSGFTSEANYNRGFGHKCGSKPD